MKIGIDIREAVAKRKTGKGVFAFNLIKALLSIDKKNEYILYSDKDLPTGFTYPKNTEIRIIQKSPLIWHFSVIKNFAANNGDLFFAPTSFVIPSFLPEKIKQIIVVHDLVAFLFPKIHQIKAVVLEKIFLKKALQKTEYVIAVSENTKKDLMKFFPFVPKEKITVIYPAASDIFSKKIKKYELEEFKKSKNLPEKFILTVSTIEPRKNLELLIKAVQEIPDANLVIVGAEGWKTKKLIKMISDMARIYFLNYLADEDLAKIYKLAEVFVFPSIYEGFGIPPLEAMKSGCPVVCSDSSSLPEVVNDAAFLFKPNDAENLKTQIQRVLKNTELRGELIRRGFSQAEKFSWKESAKKLLNVIASIAK